MSHANGHRRIRALLIFCIVFPLCATSAHANFLSDLLSRYRHYQSEKIVFRIATPRMLSWDYLSNYREIARLHVEFDTWNEPLKVNEPYNGEGTALYITKPERSAELPAQLRRNCTAIFGTKVIICDGLFLNDMGRCLEDPNVSIKVEEGDDPEMHGIVIEVMHMKAMALLNWTLGHEIGHVAKGHTTKPPSEGWMAPISNSPVVGNRAEIEADEYAFQSMFRGGHDETRYLVGMFHQTIGLLAYGLPFDSDNDIFYNPSGHPPIAARLYNAWAIYKRDYDFVFPTTMTPDDEHIHSMMAKARWVPSTDASNTFCKDSERKAYDYPMLPALHSNEYELVRSLLLGWSYRNREWSAGILREVSASATQANGLLKNQKFVMLLSDLNSLVFAEADADKGELAARIKTVAGKGLPGEPPSASLFAQTLASAVYEGSGLGEAWDSATSQEMLNTFDESRGALSKLSFSADDDVASLAFSPIPILLLPDPKLIGSSGWMRLIRQILEDANAEGTEVITNYITSWVESPGFLTALSAGETSDEAAREWNTIDALYVAAHYGSYDSYAARYKEDELTFLLKRGNSPPLQTWEMYYEVAHRLVSRDQDTALNLSRIALAALLSDDAASGSSHKGNTEFEIRFRNMIGWVLTQRKEFAEAVKILVPAEQLALKAACSWLDPGEFCISGQHPALVYIWDNLAEAQLGLGNIEQATRYVKDAGQYRDEEKKDPKFKGFPAGALIGSAKVRAACLLTGNTADQAEALALIHGISDTVEIELFPRRPSDAMFVVTVAGKPMNLITHLKVPPNWENRIDVFGTSGR